MRNAHKVLVGKHEKMKKNYEYNEGNGLGSSAI